MRVRLRGTVQGVGFRPHVHRLATEMGLAGTVGNDPDGVHIEVEGPTPLVQRFTEQVVQEAPPLATVDDVQIEELAELGQVGFTIRPSTAGGPARVLVSPDVATCTDCLAELFDPTDRRYRHPFISCTNCGPRYSIVRGLPYDRATTTMSDFPMCAVCRSEYRDPTDRRFHAQPICCLDCGPRLALVAPNGTVVDDREPVDSAAARLDGGQILAIKGLGGYQLAADAASEAAVARLRASKHREDKPFAVMVQDVDAARELCEIRETDADLLTSWERPIVLLPRRSTAAVAPAVARGARTLGVMLPTTAIHHLLMHATHGPLVMTSGNRSDEPIAHRDQDAYERLGSMVDALLVHDRPIHVRVDDSVARSVADTPVVLRRARGYAPAPVMLPWRARRHVLAVGAQLKNTVAVLRDRHVFLSPHIGDLHDHATYEAFEHAVAHLQRLFAVEPAVIAHDLHPQYLSTAHAHDLAAAADIALAGVQHHHAHVASCLVDNGAHTPVVGVAFDGTGWGPDGTVWGGEVLLADLASYERVAHLERVPLPGGEAAIREPWRTALAYLDAVGAADEDTAVRARHADRWEALRSAARAGFNSPMTSSAGRLFDAVAALIGVRDAITYEGQAAVELERLAEGWHEDVDVDAYDARITPGTPATIHGTDLFLTSLGDLADGRSPAQVAARFHAGLAAVTADVAARAAQEHDLHTVALSGGVFQNRILTEHLTDRLSRRGLRVLRHRRIPPNDGGISLGQAAIVAARDLGT